MPGLPLRLERREPAWRLLGQLVVHAADTQRARPLAGHAAGDWLAD